MRIGIWENERERIFGVQDRGIEDHRIQVAVKGGRGEKQSDLDKFQDQTRRLVKDLDTG